MKKDRQATTRHVLCNTETIFELRMQVKFISFVT